MRKGNFITAYIALLAVEGGYSNKASDLGKETYKGISRRNWPNWEGWVIVDALKDVNVSDKENTRLLDDEPRLNGLVQHFYKTEFWDRLYADELPEGIAEELFDTAVNQGLPTASRYLQEAINLLNLNGRVFKDIGEDGKIGPMSKAAFDAVRLYYTKRYGQGLFERNFVKVLDGLQFMKYHDICEARPNQEVNFFGWINQRIDNVG